MPKRVTKHTSSVQEQREPKLGSVMRNRAKPRAKQRQGPRIEFVSIEEDTVEKFPARYAITALFLLVLLSVVSVIQYAESVRLQYLVKNAEVLRREKVREHSELDYQRQSLSSLDRSGAIAPEMVGIESEGDKP